MPQSEALKNAKKRYYEKNKLKIKEHNTNYYQEHKEEISKQKKEYYLRKKAIKNQTENTVKIICV